VRGRDAGKDRLSRLAALDAKQTTLSGDGGDDGAVGVDRDAGHRRHGGTAEFLPIRLEGAVAPPDQLIRGADPQIALRIFGKGGGRQHAYVLVPADAVGVIADDLTHTTARLGKRAGDPDAMPPIFVDGGDPTTHAIDEPTVFPTQESCGGANPQRS